MKVNQKEEDLNLMQERLYLNLDLYAQNLAMLSLHIEDYSLHKAVFSSNLPLIRRICALER